MFVQDPDHVHHRTWSRPRFVFRSGFAVRPNRVLRDHFVPAFNTVRNNNEAVFVQHLDHVQPRPHRRSRFFSRSGLASRADRFFVNTSSPSPTPTLCLTKMFPDNKREKRREETKSVRLTVVSTNIINVYYYTIPWKQSLQLLVDGKKKHRWSFIPRTRITRILKSNYQQLVHQR